MEKERTEFFRKAMEKGSVCPCCDRFGKVYRTRYSASLAKITIWLYWHSYNGSWVDVPKRGPRWVLTSNSIGKLAKWGLAEAMPNTIDPERKTIGMWRITQHGREVVERRREVREYLYLYNDKRFHVPDERPPAVSIDQALLSGGFNYAEVMAEMGPPGPGAKV